MITCKDCNLRGKVVHIAEIIELCEEMKATAYQYTSYGEMIDKIVLILETKLKAELNTKY